MIRSNVYVALTTWIPPKGLSFFRTFRAISSSLSNNSPSTIETVLMIRRAISMLVKVFP